MQKHGFKRAKLPYPILKQWTGINLENSFKLIGIEAEGDFEHVIQEAGIVASDLAPNEEAVDLFRVVRGERGVSQYFTEEVELFYQRSWGSKLKSALSIGRA